MTLTLNLWHVVLPLILIADIAGWFWMLRMYRRAVERAAQHSRDANHTRAVIWLVAYGRVSDDEKVAACRVYLRSLGLDYSHQPHVLEWPGR